VNGAKNILKRAMGYMLMAGAVVAQPEGGSFIMHTPQPLKLPVEAPDFSRGRRTHVKTM